MHITRRTFLRRSMAGAGSGWAATMAAWFTSNRDGVCRHGQGRDAPVSFWFNGNGIPERYGFRAKPARVRDDAVSRAARVAAQRTMSSAASTMAAPDRRGRVRPSQIDQRRRLRWPIRGRGAGGASIDQVIAAGMAGKTRFNSLQVGVCQDRTAKTSIANMSWAGADRALPRDDPQQPFDRLFGVRRDVGRP